MPSGPLMPLSRVCCTEMGTTTRPAVPTSASSRVRPKPSLSSGDRASPRRSVSRAEISSPLSTLVPSCGQLVLGRQVDAHGVTASVS